MAKTNKNQKQSKAQIEKQNKIKKELQATRENNMNRDKERYALVEFEDTNEVIKFVLINMVNNKNVKITIQKGEKVSCNCFDFKIRCIKNNINCKHVLYILTQILRLPSNFFQDNKVNNKFDLTEALKKVSLERSNINNKFKVDENRVYTDDDLCAVCFVPLNEEGLESLIKCPSCKNALHGDCLKTWLSYGANKKCVYCRDTQIASVKF